MDVRKTEAIMPEDNRATDNIKIGYRLKKTGSNKFRCWITYHSRRDMYLMDSEYWCTVFSREVLASESELNRLVSCGELTSIETRYIESSDQYNSTKKNVVDENGNQLNVDSRHWKYFDWTEADKECNTPVCMNDH